MTKQEFEQRQRDIESVRRKRDEYVGALAQLQKELSEMEGLETVAEAKALLSSMKKELAKFDTAIEKLVKDLHAHTNGRSKTEADD